MRALGRMMFGLGIVMLVLARTDATRWIGGALRTRVRRLGKHGHSFGVLPPDHSTEHQENRPHHTLPVNGSADCRNRLPDEETP